MAPKRAFLAQRQRGLLVSSAAHLPSGKMPWAAIHSKDSSYTSLVEGSNTGRSPGRQRRVSIKLWKRSGNSFLY